MSDAKGELGPSPPRSKWDDRLWRTAQFAQLGGIVVAVAAYFLQALPLQKSEAQLDAKTAELKKREEAFEKAYSNFRQAVVNQIAIRALLECPGSKWSADGRFAGYVNASGRASLSDLRFAENIGRCVERAALAEGSFLSLRAEDRDQFGLAISLFQESLAPARIHGMQEIARLPQLIGDHPESFPSLSEDDLRSGKCGTERDSDQIRRSMRDKCLLQIETSKIVERYVRDVDKQIRTLGTIEWKSLGGVRRVLNASAASAASEPASKSGFVIAPDGSLNRGMVKPDQ